MSIEIIIAPREKDLGSFSVRRILPYASHRMVGPFIFFDHLGPADFMPGTGMDVRPHPHIGLATVTYLFDGKMRHRDSLGNDQIIEPGAINWMTAGRGIVHSERSPADFRASGGFMNGIQIWVALPAKEEDTAPSFVHHPTATLPEFNVDAVSVKLLIGSFLNFKSPVKTHSELFYYELKMPKDSSLKLPPQAETAAYVVDGKVKVDGVEVEQYSMAVSKKCQPLFIEAEHASRVMILGGEPVGERFIYWNLISSKQEKIETAKAAWANCPGPGSELFPKIPGDEIEFIPLPDTPGNPKGTPL